MKTLTKNFIFVLMIFLALSAVFSLFQKPAEKTLAISQLAELINQEKIKKIVISGNNLGVIYQDDSQARSTKEAEATLSESLLNYGVDKTKLAKVEVENKETGDVWSWLGPVLFTILPLLIIGFFFWGIFRQARTGAMQAFDFTKARARLFGAEGHGQEKITFKDAAGLKEAKQELMEVVDFLKNPKKYLAIGAKIPRGVLLLGPSGVGKTLLARAVAGESNVPFLSISGSEFVELFVGTGAARVRSLFQEAKKLGRCIIFVDELDAVGRTRGMGFTGGHEEREQTLNQILVEMDGFEKNAATLVFAATNRPDVLDPALLRPGRFDRKVVLDLPDINDREEILIIHARNKPLSSNVKLREIAERTPGFSGADLANVVNEAAILTARRNQTQISQEEFLESVEKVLLGPERKSHILSPKEKEIAAWHEAGHALVSSSLPGSEPVRKVSIVARGMAAGYTLKMPAEEKKMKTKTEFLAEISTLLAGFCAEKLRFGEITTGASNDLEKASDLTRRLIKEYGMSSLGPIAFGEKEESMFLGREFGEYKNYSEKVASQIDEEVKKTINAAQKEAERVLSRKKKLLEKIAKTLIQKETIEREEFERLIKSSTKTKK